MHLSPTKCKFAVSKEYAGRFAQKTNKVQYDKIMTKPDRQLAEKLLKISAIKLQPDIPFVWGSGWNSPIYNDNRRILSYPDVRNYVKVEIAKNIIEHFGNADVIASVSTASIPLGALVADTLGLPFIFVRETPKDHGLENLIEGNLKPGQKVAMIEDVISTAGGTLRATEVINNAGGEVLGGVAVFHYEFPMAVKRLNDTNVDMIALCTYNSMVEAAVDMKYIEPGDVETLKAWRKDPANWVPDTDNFSKLTNL